MRLSTALLAAPALALPLYRLNLGLVTINLPSLTDDPSTPDTNTSPLLSLNIPGTSGSTSNNSDPSLTSNDLVQGDPAACPGVVFIWARGSMEEGNMGALGPLVAKVLKDKYDDGNNHNNGSGTGVWVQGVGKPYAATLLDNALPQGTSEVATREMARLFELARAKCPNIKILAGGYSQGSAVTANAISDPVLLTPDTRDRIRGVVLFGYTRNEQNNGQIPGYPSDRLKVFCAQDDLVCDGSLIVTDAHYHYAVDAEAGGKFLISKV